MAQEEQVLVIERKILELSGMFQGITFDVERYLSAIFVAGVPRFMPRSLAENDPAFKQLIPYVIITHDGKYLSYVRGKRAGETRLVGQRSIGIGGHINPVDNMPLFNTDFRDAYLSAVKREVEEEIHIESNYSNSVVALLNDDSNEVGRVHLGIVHLWHLESAKVIKKEQMITQLDFISQNELIELRDTMETWSMTCLDNLTAISEKMSHGKKNNESSESGVSLVSPSV